MADLKICALLPMDLKPIICSYVNNEWQTEWDLYKLHENSIIKIFSYQWDQIVYIRCRIGRSRMTQVCNTREDPPTCSLCRIHLTIKHGLSDCAVFIYF